MKDITKNHRKTGYEKETLAIQYLERQGLVFKERNFYCNFGEIDLIFKEQNTVVFVEVKYRSDEKYGSGGEAVTKTKQKRIYRCAQYYLYRNFHSTDVPCRFDLVVIDGEKISWIPNAFGGL